MILACANCGARSADVPSGLLARVAMAGCAKCGSHDIDFADELFGPLGSDAGQTGHEGVKTASDDLGPGSGGVMGLVHALVDHFKHGGDHDRIPEWFPRRLLTDEEVKTGHWVGAHGLEHAFSSLIAEATEHSFLDEKEPGELWAGADTSKHSSEGDGGEHNGPKDECPLCRSNASLQSEAAGVVIPVQFNPKGDPWTFLKEQLGTVSVDHLENIGGGIWAGTLIVPEGLADDARNLGHSDLAMAATKKAAGPTRCMNCGKNLVLVDDLSPDIHGKTHQHWIDPQGYPECRDPKSPFNAPMRGQNPGGAMYHVPISIADQMYAENRAARSAVLKKAAWGLFNSDDHKLVYGPTTKEAVEMALASGRYKSGYYVGTLPDHPGSEWAPPPDFQREDPFQNVTERSPFSAKVAEIVEGIQATNPGLGPIEAQRIAREAVARYPGLLAARDVTATCVHCGKQINRGEGVGERQWLHVDTSDGLCADRQNTADPKKESS